MRTVVDPKILPDTVVVYRRVYSVRVTASRLKTAEEGKRGAALATRMTSMPSRNLPGERNSSRNLATIRRPTDDMSSQRRSRHSRAAHPYSKWRTTGDVDVHFITEGNRSRHCVACNRVARAEHLDRQSFFFSSDHLAGSLREKPTV